MISRVLRDCRRQFTLVKFMVSASILQSTKMPSFFSPSADCHLDEANGYDFTGKGMLDNDGNGISGYAYVASFEYPFIPIKYRGSTAQTEVVEVTDLDVKNSIPVNTFDC